MMQNQSLNVVYNQSNFERGIDVSRRKDLGVFLTNNIKTVDNILEIIDFEDLSILSKKFLEPPCGNGVFLVRLLEKLFSSDADEEPVSNFISSNIFFVDIDENMVEKTKSNISKFYKTLFGHDYNGRFNSFVFDFT